MELRSIYDATLNGKINEIGALVQDVIDQGISVLDILKEGLTPAMEEVGDRFEAEEYFLPEMLAAAEAMKRAMLVMQPHMTAGDLECRGVVVAGTVQGDLHDIGKNLVCMMLDVAGFRVVDLGTDVSAEGFMQTAERESADIIAMSALISSTKGKMKEIIHDLRAGGIEGHPRIMIGGAPITREYCDEIGADGYAPDAVGAVREARKLLQLD
jgi:5-methyltetrahydrofolate--homocysteine methyltransferase